MLMPEEYFIVEAKASEWVYVIQKIIRDTAGVEVGDIILSLELPYPVYYLRRTRFDATTLAVAFGGNIAQIRKAKIIRLEPFEASGKLPHPNVPYHGEA